MGWERVSHPSTLRMAIWPEARSAQNSMGTVSAQGRTAWVLMRPRNSSFRRLIALVVRADFHCDGSRRVKVKSRSPASSKLSATARHFKRHFRRNALRRVSTERDARIAEIREEANAAVQTAQTDRDQRIAEERERAAAAEKAREDAVETYARRVDELAARIGEMSARLAELAAPAAE